MCIFFFFFQAEDGIRDKLVTGVQTCALPISVGEGWYRYNHDAYGETPDGGKYDGSSGVGRLWTLLTGERGEYDIAAGDLAKIGRASCRERVEIEDGEVVVEKKQRRI